MKMGRPPQIYLPLPYCKNGHRRTAKNTRWRVLVLNKKYEYLMARCAICEAAAQKQRNSYHEKLAKLRKRVSQQPLQIDDGGGPG